MRVPTTIIELPVLDFVLLAVGTGPEKLLTVSRQRLSLASAPADVAQTLHSTLSKVKNEVVFKLDDHRSP